MGYEAEREAIEGHFGPIWHGRTRVGYDGQNFDPSDESVQINILQGESASKTIGAPGSNIARYTGVVAVRVYVGKDKSTHYSRKIEDQICDIFRNLELENLRFRVPYVENGGIGDVYRVRTVMCPFVRDEFHA